MLNDPSFWYAVSFVLFIGLLGRPVSKVIMAALQSNQQAIQKQLFEAQELRQKAQAFLDEAQQCRQDALHEAQQILDHATQEALRTQELAQAEVNQFFVVQEQQLQERLSQLEYEAKDALKKQLGDLVLATTVKSLQENYIASLDQKVVQETVRTLAL
jgi:F0F1-type ATP synthase, subunit b